MIDRIETTAAVWSASLVAVFVDDPERRANCRPWNGHVLTETEILRARAAAMQAAYEWLSEHVR